MRCLVACVLALGATAAAAPARVIYLQRDGIEVTHGADDARARTSSIIARPTSFAPWDTDAATWSAVTDCVAELFARFDVAIVDRAPAPGASYVEAVFTHRPDGVFDDEDRGMAPFASDCSVIENAIVFAFVDGLDARGVCEVAAHEIAHAYGVEHALLDTDLMSYLPRRGPRAFQDRAVPCGELEARPCACRASQNTVRVLAGELGVTAPLDGPIEVSDGCAATAKPPSWLLLLLVAWLGRRV